MILEGFEIENWSCIKRLAVDGLPATGLIVLHGPNGTGKSSVVEALRACLMDNKSTSMSLGRASSIRTEEKPLVCVTFRALGDSWRITKRFGTKQSRLERRTASGEWALESSDATEAHTRVRELTGGADSDQGLHQLMWLTQSEFRLPKTKDLDGSVQARLRAILGILQTPLDDAFLRHVQEGWSHWFTNQQTPGKKPKLKRDCSLDKDLKALEEARVDLNSTEARYDEHERMAERSTSLEVRVRGLERDLDKRLEAGKRLQAEYESSVARIKQFEIANQAFEVAQKAVYDAEQCQRLRDRLEAQAQQAEKDAIKARTDADEKALQLHTAKERLNRLHDDVRILTDAGLALQERRNAVVERLQRLGLTDQLTAARATLEQATKTHQHIERLKSESRQHPAPDNATMRALQDNRTAAEKLRAQLDAAALVVVLRPIAGASAAEVRVDGGVPLTPSPEPVRITVQRQAHLAIAGWGAIDITRGSDTGSLDELHRKLNDLERAFAEKLAPYGVPAGPGILDTLWERATHRTVREAELTQRQAELKQLAPAGLEPWRDKVAELERRLSARATSTAKLPATQPELEELAAGLAHQCAENAKASQAVALEATALGKAIDQPSGLRAQHAAAHDTLRTHQDYAKVRRDDLARMLVTEAQIETQMQEAQAALKRAREDIKAAELTEDEATILDRRKSAEQAVRALRSEIAEVNRQLHQNEGALRQTEGLHAKRTAAAVRVEELERRIARERLEADGYDRLYALFEQCRERQLGTVMGPVHDRVLHWMQWLRIGNYRSIRFTDQFLPESLITHNGENGLPLDHESLGTIEQIGLMVRLALGALLSTPTEPAIAVLDDPLTHSDTARLDLMRAVLCKAAEGEPSAAPPTGPLQIVVFTCHPEWFRTDDAHVVDLTEPGVLTHCNGRVNEPRP